MLKQRTSSLLFTILFFLIITETFAVEKPYFQQEVNYKIRVTLDDKKNTLSAQEEIVYINHSPDTLFELWFHLWPNAYKNDSTALCKQLLEEGISSLYFAKPESRGFIDSIDFTSNGVSIKWEYNKEHIDICKLTLNSPLTPGEQVIISTPFYVKIPSGLFSRLGHIGQAYAISQWYPKPAVYDRDGWHEMPNLDQGEFYSEFGSFEVAITLPENYVVGATGDLQNGEDEIFRLEQNAIETSHLTTFTQDLTFPPSSSKTKTLVYKQNNIHDFAWFADKRFHVLKDEVTLPKSGKKVTTWAMFTNSEPYLWKNSLTYLRDALLFYSDKIGDYPYNQISIVDGTISAGGGMEYPTISIIGTSGDPLTLEYTIAHEIGHNWFYGILGSNERQHPWMDEGINSFYESSYMLSKYPSNQYRGVNELSGYGIISKIAGTNSLDFKQTEEFLYKIAASSRTDQPIETKATEFTINNYNSIVYYKTAISFHYLKSYLGDSIFDICMQKYFQTWQYKHPSPADLSKIFEEQSGKDVLWFFSDLLNTDRKQDYGITCLKKNKNGYTLRIKQKQELRSPLPVSGLKSGKIITQQWILPTEKFSEIEVPCKDCDEISIDPEFQTIDLRRQDNQIRTHGLLKQLETISLSMPWHLEYPTRTRLFWLPAPAWNNYNKFMMGLVIHNKFLPFRKFEFEFVPLYATGNNSFVGIGEINYNFYLKNGIFSSIVPGINYRRFAFEENDYKNSEGGLTNTTLNYQRIASSLLFNIRKINPRSSVDQSINLRMIHLSTEEINYRQVDSMNIGEVNTRNSEFYRVDYNLTNSRKLDPWSTSIRLEGNDDFQKISATWNYKISYANSKKGVNLRLFAGYVLNQKADNIFGFSMSDNNDYAFDDYYFGRSEYKGVLAKQMVVREGGFKSYSPLGTNKKWLTTININVDLPIRLPIRLFADLGTYDNYKTEIQQIYDIKTSFSYDAGVSIFLIRNVVEVFIPIIRSEEINKYQSTNNIKFREQIRFIFDISKLNPLSYRKELIK